mmetsp:Transcript_26827/g.48736  ORF Transcript_26827/g.48736 Transcript_26827/m.48736 type:complete len:344 (-) Transcript_26827:286-1317(-)|eukprot:CAMPEP_0198297222 /NCGR_PEP_ID=MMETSP1449-20131203/36070_1 /TAXON_ID=420275 /ORGANISM="Attheya septentrionalis, Strain CCMP2084" /LENGTH=343 /DNA_ID=CAMNT_0043998097 /DNA_START=128 /DNA_END=1159 /DNA_ORIENTATION=+
MSGQFVDDERFDGLYLNVANTTRGIEPLLDTVFSFLRRKTDFLAGPNGQGSEVAIAKVNEVLQKHVDIYEATNRKVKSSPKKKPASKTKEVKKQTKTQPAAAPKPEEAGVIELGDDGFDISNVPDSVDTPKPAADDVSSSPPAKTKEAKPPPVETSTAVAPTIEETEDGKLVPSIGNGSSVEGKYFWTQTLPEVTVTVPLPENTRARDLTVVIAKKKLKVGLKSQKDAIVDAPLTRAIICDDSFWTIEDGNHLVINLQKSNQMEWWDAICEGDPMIDVTKVEPETSQLGDLEGDTRQTVEKMMFDQRQKALGLPTSEEQKKWDIIEKFKKSHPDMDFSNAKIT